MNASAKTIPFSRLAAIIASTSAREIAIGFSHNTCTPALSAAMVHSACRWLGRLIYTASMAPDSSIVS